MVTISSFSGGRSSAMMSYEGINDCDFDMHIFCNTGKEHPATLDFVKECDERWELGVIWLEYTGKKSYKVVNFDTASRNGEPFAQLITDKKYLPNMVARFCTSFLKVIPIEQYLADQGIEDYEMAVGIRADEPRRVAKMRAKDNYLVPLADKGVVEQDVHDFWQRQPFDLALPDAAHNLYSNCDLCFLKGGRIKQSLIKESPCLADWWAEQEARIGGKFRSDQLDYAAMKIKAATQDDLFGDDETIPCFCGD